MVSLNHRGGDTRWLSWNWEGGALLQFGSHGHFAGIGVGVGALGFAKIIPGAFCVFWSCLTTCSEDGKITGKGRQDDNLCALAGIHYRYDMSTIPTGCEDVGYGRSLGHSHDIWKRATEAASSFEEHQTTKFEYHKLS